MTVVEKGKKSEVVSRFYYILLSKTRIPCDPMIPMSLAGSCSEVLNMDNDSDILRDFVQILSRFAQKVNLLKKLYICDRIREFRVY